jgi:hypothetical protein
MSFPRPPTLRAQKYSHKPVYVPFNLKQPIRQDTGQTLIRPTTIYNGQSVSHIRSAVRCQYTITSDKNLMCKNKTNCQFHDSQTIAHTRTLRIYIRNSRIAWTEPRSHRCTYSDNDAHAGPRGSVYHPFNRLVLSK